MSAGANKLGKETFRKGASSGQWAFMMVLFSTTIFTSAALLFLIEPMFAKFVLPSFGGTPAVWTGSIMFFQAALLTSYLYVHATTAWLGARKQAWLHLAVVAVPLLLFAFTGAVNVPAEEWAPPPDANPLFWLLGLLLVSIGLPFFAISATNPLIQRWLADTDHPSARDPYFLYRASNLGSVIGLLGYPLLMEPNMRLANQGIFWTIGYGVFVLLVIASALVLWRSAPVTETVQEEEEPLSGDQISGGGSSQVDSGSAGLYTAPTMLRRLRWIGLAFVPSSMMLGVTAFITTDITPVPLLWVIPLSLYLFSFVVVFSTNQTLPGSIHKVMAAALPLVMALLVVSTLTTLRNPFWLLILLHLGGFFVVAMTLHGELARDRPPARNLTEFYLWVAFGGVLGGIFNALIAPVVFNTVVEYPLAIVLACMFVPGTLLARMLRPRNRQEQEEQPVQDQEPVRDEGANSWWWLPVVLDVALPLALGVTVYVLGQSIDAINPSPEWVINWFGEDWRSTFWQLTLGLAVGLCLFFIYVNNRSIRFGLGIAALIVAAGLASGTGSTLFEDRSFFGLYRITEGADDPNYRALVVGNTNHGAQVLGDTPPVPIAYHDRTGPFGQLFEQLPEEVTDESPVAVFGLGAGVMSCYAEPGQQWDFFEIDPLVEQIARNPNLFTYLRDCPGQYDVVLGDARLKMADADDGRYGMIVGEAFSSDAIPVHTLTREAFDMYLDKLTDNGVLVMHISNRHLDLEPVIGDLAATTGLTCYSQYDADTQNAESPYPQYKLASHFTVLARNEADLGNVPTDGRWQPCTSNPNPEESVWTDDFSNLLSTFVFS